MDSHDPVKTLGAWEVRRKIDLAAVSGQATASRLARVLAAAKGMQGVRIDLGTAVVQLHYDITKTDFEALQRTIEANGARCPRRFLARMKARWCQYVDLAGRENAGIKPAACCNKPPPHVNSSVNSLWRLYMAGYAYHFDEGSIGLHQLLAGHRHQSAGLPLRRDALYTGDSHQEQPQ